MFFRCHSEGEDIIVSPAFSNMKRIYFLIKPQTNLINMEYIVQKDIASLIYYMYVYFFHS